MMHIKASSRARRMMEAVYPNGLDLTMTRIEAIEILLHQLQKDNPAQFAQFMRELLDAMGYVDVVDAMDGLLDRDRPLPPTLH